MVNGLPNTPCSAWSDAQLTASLTQGSRDAFAEIYERYWSPLYRVAYQKLRVQEVAEELVQDLFVSVWQKRELLIINQLKSYLFSALRFSIIDHIRTLTVHERFVAYYEAFASDTDYQTENALALHDLTEAVERSLQTLPDKSQTVFRLSRFEHLTIPEIAQRLDLSEKAVEYHLTRALTALRGQLAGYGLVLAAFLF